MILPQEFYNIAWPTQLSRDYVRNYVKMIFKIDPLFKNDVVT